MSEIQVTPPPRNLTMECCKMVAAIFVVFIHAPFPGGAGTLAMALGRFAVPMFFAITGYFNYGAVSRQVSRRLWHIVKLFAAALIIYVIWNCWMEGLQNYQEIRDYVIPDLSHLFSFLILHVHPFPRSEHLWYLIALIAVYCVFWVYTRFYGDGNVNYHGLYIGGFILFVVYALFTVVLPLDSVDIPYRSYRNGWFSGIPMFALGVFLHEYQERILRRFRLSPIKLIGLIFFGFLLTAAQWKCKLATDMPIGILVSTPAIVLFCIKYPQLPFHSPWSDRAASKLGAISTIVYILHVMVYFTILERFPLFAEAHPWLLPWLVLLISLVLAIVWETLCALSRHARTPVKA